MCQITIVLGRSFHVNISPQKAACLCSARPCMPPCGIYPHPCQLPIVTLRHPLPHLLTQTVNPPVLCWSASACLLCSPLLPCEASPLLVHTFFIQHTSSPQLHRSLSPSMFLTPCCQVSNPNAAASTQFYRSIKFFLSLYTGLIH